MYVKAFAKINVYLDVASSRDDGYHNLEMVMLPIELHDSISIDLLPTLVTDSYVVCDKVNLGPGEYNLINRTLKKMREVYGFKQNFNINIHKEIPICAGLGGGSSNAAATMHALYKLLKIDETLDNKLSIGEALGSDVPFCLLNKPSFVEGKGEKLTPIKLKSKYNVLIIMPEKGLSTKVVFAESNKFEPKHGNPKKVIEALETSNDELLAEYMFNSLQEVSNSLNPDIEKIINMMKNDGLPCSMMTGSGSAVFALTRDKKLAKKLASKYINLGYDVYLTSTL